MKALKLMLVCLVAVCHVHAQRHCGTDEYVKSQPEIVFNRLGDISGPSRDTVPGEVIVIPVVIHVLYKTNDQNISDAQILSQLKVLNDDFRRLNADTISTPMVFRGVSADARIVFCLAKIDPDGRLTSGINRVKSSKDFFMMNDEMKFKQSGGVNAWDPSKYLNIWVCPLFGRNLGYATLPGGPENKDGVVINHNVFGTKGTVRAPFNKGRTATHEVAHWLGLKHIWGEDYCGSDDVDDTPKQETYNFNCPVFPSVSKCSPNANGDMFMNFMDFTDDACMNMFTVGQKNKMRGVFAKGNLRNSLLSSYVCDSSLAVAGPLPRDTVAEVLPPVSISVYPNPVVDDVRFSFDHPSESLKGYSVQVFNMSGVKLSQQILSGNKDAVPMKQFAPGVYYIRLTGADIQKTFKVIRL